MAFWLVSLLDSLVEICDITVGLYDALCSGKSIWCTDSTHETTVYLFSCSMPVQEEDCTASWRNLIYRIL